MHPDKTEKFDFLEKLGEGNYASVYRAISTIAFKVDRETEEVVAIKEMVMSKEEDGVPSSTIRQIGLLKELQHDNILRLQQVLRMRQTFCLVFQFIEQDLKKFINSTNRQVGMDPLVTKVNQPLSQKLCYQLLLGVAHCHEKKILHRDLKPQNLLISNKKILKIADFGLARAFNIPTKPFTPEVVTLWYRSPDVLLGNTNYCQSIDIWSVGCILAEISTLKPLFPGKNVQDQLEKIFFILGTPNQERHKFLANLKDYAKYNFEERNPQPLGEFIRLDELGLDLLQVKIGNIIENVGNRSIKADISS